MIRSAAEIAFQMVDSNAGEGRPSQCARFRAARMLAAINSTRLRPSSMQNALYQIRRLFAHHHLTAMRSSEPKTRRTSKGSQQRQQPRFSSHNLKYFA